MEYQVTINYQFSAENENEAREKAQSYVSNNLSIKQLKDSIISPLQVAEQCKSFRDKKKEHFYIFFLDTQNRITGKEIVSIGTLNASIIHPRECFRTAILKNTCSVIFVHNHPSGSLEPSTEDLARCSWIKPVPAKPSSVFHPTNTMGCTECSP